MKRNLLYQIWRISQIVLIGIIFGCTIPSMKATFEDGSISTFPEHYRKKAMEYEGTGDLYRSLQSWEIVRSFQTDDQEVAKKIKDLKVKLNSLADEHFNKGVSHYKNNDVRASRNEFLLALQFNPEHKVALEYLKDKLAGEDFRMYEVKKGDTLKEIARKIYDDPQKEFLIAYFNDMGKDAKLIPETTLRLPVLESIPKKKVTDTKETQTYQTYFKEIPFDSKEILNKAQVYLKNKKYQEAISATETILQYDPTNRDALDLSEASYYQMANLFVQQKRYQEALEIFNHLEPAYKDVKESLAFVKRKLAEEHYLKGIKYYTDEELDKAIKEWDATLALNPNHPKAKKDIENARGLLQRLKEIK